MTEEVLNARIKSTMLGWKETGTLTYALYVEYNMFHQVVGGHTLDKYIEGTRVPGDMGMRLVAAILKVVGVECWEELPGKYLRVILSDESLAADAIGIQNILDDDKTLIFKDFFALEAQRKERIQ